jgi:uncharacterized small protein (DUF1192 family)
MNKEKVQKEYPGFANEVDNLSVPELKERIVGMQKALEESEAHKEENDELKSLRAQVLELSAPYRDVKKAVKAKTSYILELLKDKGV